MTFVKHVKFTREIPLTKPACQGAEHLSLSRKRQRFTDSEEEREERGGREGKRMDIICHLTQRSRVCKKVKYVESEVCV